MLDFLLKLYGKGILFYSIRTAPLLVRSENLLYLKTIKSREKYLYTVKTSVRRWLIYKMRAII